MLKVRRSVLAAAAALGFAAHSSGHNGFIILKTLGDVPLQRVAHKTSIGLDPEPFHHPVFVKRHGPVRDAEPVGNPLHRMSGSQ